MREHRMVRAIAPDYILPDERNLTDFLLYLRVLSENINYYNSKNKIDGDWSFFFKSDSAVLFSEILSTDIKGLENRWAKLSGNLSGDEDEDEKRQRLSELYSFVSELFQLLDRWYLRSRKFKDDYESKLNGGLYNAIKFSLSRTYETFQAQMETLAEQGVLGVKVLSLTSSLNQIWIFSDREVVKSDEEEEPEELDSLLTEFINDLHLIYDELFQTITYTVSTSEKLLVETLSQNGKHSPDIALLITFIKLFSHVKTKLNSFTEKHLEYYYKELLGENLSPSKPDSVHLVMELADQFQTCELPEGLLFPADTNKDGSVNYYQLSRSIELNRVRVEQLKTLFVSKNRNFAFSDNKYRIVSNVYASPIANSIKGEGPAFSDPRRWPTFGEEQYGLSEAERTMSDAELGFIVSSPVLLLQDGVRTVHLRLRFNLRSMSALVDILDDVVTQEGVSVYDAFHKLLGHSLTLYYTSVEGWAKVKKCDIVPPKDWLSGEIGIVFTLSPSDSPLVRLPEDLETDIKLSRPAVKVILGNENAMYPYSFFSDLLVEEITIDVDIKGSKNLLVYNEGGRVDVSKSFYPFGTSPHIDSYMLVGNPELFSKDLNGINLNIKWSNLPSEHGGFETYFKEYGKDVDNDSFKVSVKALSDYKFLPEANDDDLVYGLFETKEDGTLSDTKTLSNISVDKLSIRKNPELDEIPEYTTSTKTGFLKFELIEPSMAFGHEIYPSLYANTVTDSVEKNFKTFFSSKKGRGKMALPKQPFLPYVSDLSLDYSASTTIYFSAQNTLQKTYNKHEQVAHITPFGHQFVFDKGKVSNRHIVPQFTADGYLFIGLSGAGKDQTASIYFELRKRLRSGGNGIRPRLVWQYLDNEDWFDFGQRDIVADSTKGFTTSGIVELRLPKSFGKENTSMPNGLHWIRVVASGDVHTLSDTVLVAAQGVKADWKGTLNGKGNWKEHIKAKTIRSFQTGIPEVRFVEQPFDSFGGKSPESDRDFYARVSERLRHKNRALTGWDFERLVLENFQDISQVRCLTHSTAPSLVGSKQLCMVLFPVVETNDKFYEPRLDFARLETVRKFLSRVSSPFATIRTMNPIFERVKVSCRVVFEDNPGEERQSDGYNISRLNEDIYQYFCPWLYGEREGVGLGGSFELEHLLRYLESLSYVRFVTGFSVIHLYKNEKNETIKKDSATDLGLSKKMKASSPASILMPVARHDIRVIEKTIHELPTASALDNMEFDVDFVVEDREDDDELGIRGKENKPTEDPDEFTQITINV
ncbi:baseplate J/gp47 family protein [Fulvitalea axinellae]